MREPEPLQYGYIACGAWAVSKARCPIVRRMIALCSLTEKQGWTGGNYKKLNRPFENKLTGLPREIRERMINRVEDFVYNMLINVFNAGDTAPLAINAILEAGSYDPGPKGTRIEDPAEWTKDKIIERAKSIDSDKGPEGDFDD